MENNDNVQEVPSVEILQGEASLSLITKAEIDIQISTAKAFPRSLTKFMRSAMSMATISEGVAESCAYALPRGGKTLEGPSVRLAEIAVSAFGNIRAGSRVIYKDNKIIRAQGICHDLESNTCVTIETERRITDRNGKTFNDDMIVVTGNAACAIAFRNAVFKVIPAALISDVYDKVKEVAKGSAETLPARRAKRLQYFYDLKITKEQVANSLGVADVNDIDLDKLGILNGMVTAHKTNESTLAELFPEPEAKGKADKATQGTLDAIAKQSAKAKG